LSTNFDETFERVECDDYEETYFGGDPDHVANLGIFSEIFTTAGEGQ